MFPDSELEPGEIPVTGPFGNRVPESISHKEKRKCAKKEKSKLKKAKAIAAAKVQQEQVTKLSARASGLSRFLTEIRVENQELRGTVRHYLRIEKQAEETVARILAKSKSSEASSSTPDLSKEANGTS
jgi:hypothetical protein